MLHDNFIKTAKQEGPEFKALLNILSSLNLHTKEGRKLLCVLNNIIDYYINREVEYSDDVKMPIVYFPLCEDWAQMLCEEFVALKMSLLWGKSTRTNILSSYKSKPFIYLPEKVNKKEREACSKHFRFKRDVAKYLTDDILDMPSNANEKCFFYSRTLSDEYNLSLKTKGHYHFIQDVVGDSFSTEKSLIILNGDEDEVYKKIEKNDGRFKIPHIFLFLQKNIDGRNIQLCMKMQRSTIKEYNEDYDAGIHNVIAFLFSQKPYRLQRIYENKHSLVERWQREKFAETRDFISFTKAEMDYLFERQEPCIDFYELGCEINAEEYQIKNTFDFMIQDIAHEVKLRNELAICFTDQSLSKIKEEILNLNSEVNEEYTDYFLQLIHNKYKTELTEILYNWIKFHEIAVVLDYNIDVYYKKQLKFFLQSKCGASSVNFYTFKNFKAHKDGLVFLNSIHEQKILVLSMLNHCTGRSWAIYPNSFDQYHLNPGQSVLQINNKIVFDPRYSWYSYRYKEQLRLLLNSNYRVRYVKNGIQLPDKPIKIGIEPKEDEDEQNVRDRQSGVEQNRVKVSFGPRQHKVLDEYDFVLCKYMDEISICTILDVLRDFEDPTVISIQPLTDFYQSLEDLLDNEERRAGEGELMIRNNPKYCLTDEEKLSSREMWKILLGHRVAQYGEQVVYNDIMKPLLPAERIQFISFKRWLDTSENSVLPRSRRMQKRVIEEYLQIEGLYTRMLRHRKSRISTNTEGKNVIFRTFLIHCLLETDMKKAYKELSNEVLDYLNIGSENDIKIILDLIKDGTINFRLIKSISYDQR
ncbi:hypothetical protein [Bacteroides fragilis]|uniref:hypothetical protein n=1 Tax=Bacteroides fragilis TaxID=817 RepID=UPI0002808CA6|nr:hypothetical protein [Bacteroides fragilis]EKA90641.1 hypothetical protein HMPREF1203_01667 [Bacteroides fragilis HMW 610]MCE8543571.1 hypothetical protein [Bacteroides fragilis]MCE8571865.1 hypothetical protein [Bacteroides fragilis]MCE8642624.1 hypothetical protein [Bacteroides fragilis]MCE8643535.1 hypothetical protein [Bacteroides fragilis]